MAPYLSYPIVLSSEGRVMDGMHTAARAVLLGHATIDVVQFAIDPESDFLDLGPDELPSEDTPGE